MKLSRLIPLAGLCLVSFTAQADKTEPEKVVYDFYRYYLKAPTNEIASLVDKYVSESLLKSLDASAMCNYGNDEGQKICETKCDADRCFYYNVWVETDVNYFTKSQDTYPDWEKYIKTKLIFDNDTVAQVDVTLGKIPTHKAHYFVFLIKEKDGWKIGQVDN